MSTTRRHLVASLGPVAYKPATYVLGEREHATRYAPVALARLLGLGGARASILVTEAARSANYDALADELAEAGVVAEPVPIPAGRDEKELVLLFEALVERIRDGEGVVLDVTYALRHLPFVYLAALAFLGGLRGVQVAGVYHGAFELADAAGRAPILDLTFLLHLLDWYQALESARRSGDWTAVAHALNRENSRLFVAERGDPRLSRLAKHAARLARATRSGLPLEAGLEAAALAAALGDAEERRTLGAPARLAVEALGGQVREVACAAGVAAKGDVLLDRGELSRQLHLARIYAAHQDVPRTMALLREWLVSVAMHGGGIDRDWLGYARRKPFEARLTALARRAENELPLRPSEARLAGLWSATTAFRNFFAHAGMDATHADLTVSPAKLNALLRDAEAVLDAPEPISAPAETVLVTPLGLAPGVVFSAVGATSPDRALVVTSRDGERRLGEALTRAGRAGLPCEALLLDDPHGGFRESARLAREPAFLRALAAASTVVVNLTGGTTAMQYCVQRLGERASSLGLDVRRIALVDRRAASEQTAAPWVQGDKIDLDRLNVRGAPDEA